MKRNKNKNQNKNYSISPNDWLDFHPYNKPYLADYYYIKLANRIYNILKLPENGELFEFIYEDEFNKFSCYLTAYFEDVISQTGIWKAFTRKHNGLYNKYLPFYKLNEYFQDENNYEDVCFLIWYFFSRVNKDEVINPFEGIILKLATQINDVFNEEYEFAPENPKLNGFFDFYETDYYLVRKKIEWLVLKSYLFVFNGDELDEKLEELEEEYVDQDHDLLVGYKQDTFDSFVVRSTWPLLAMRGSEWLAEVLGPEHQMYNDLLSLGVKKSGIFLYKGFNDDYVILQHIATGKDFEVTRKSMDVTKDLHSDDTIMIISIIQWKNEWWFSGTYAAYPYNADIILDEKNSMKSRALFEEDTERQKEALEKQYHKFLEFNKNTPLVFYQSNKECAGFLNKWWAHYNKSLKLTKIEIETAIKRSKDKGFLKGGEQFTFSPEHFPDVPGMIFFNQKA